jgi:methyl acetate hydrolase
MSIDRLTDSLSSHLDKAVAAGLAGTVAAVTIDGQTVFEGAAGVRAMGQAEPMTVDTVLMIFSMTKAITGAAAMQLVERGQLTLDGPAGDVLPELGGLEVLEGFAPDGTPQLRPARTPVTLRHLLAHTSGFVYDMWDARLTQYLAVTGKPGLATMQKDAYRVPLMFEPGTQWEYGIGIDWAGLLVEAATGTTLGRYCAEHLFQPLGMRDTGFAPTPSMAERMASLHVPTADGLVPFALPAPDAPEFEMGGGGLLSTVHDYLRFANAILKGGELDGVRVLAADTVATMAANAMGDVDVVPLVSVNPMLTLDADFFPGMRSKWGLTFLINTERSPQGRPAGSLAWAGLANSFYWIDTVNRVCGVWATQLLPFFHPTAIEGFRSFETAFYDSLA